MKVNLPSHLAKCEISYVRSSVNALQDTFEGENFKGPTAKVVVGKSNHQVVEVSPIKKLCTMVSNIIY